MVGDTERFGFFSGKLTDFDLDNKWSYHRVVSNESDHLLSVDEAAHFLGVSAAKVRKDLRERTVPHIRIGRRVLFSSQRLQKFIADHAVEPVSDVSVKEAPR
ncbi:MAG: helix-turn-helix domain-containing protein [Spirochaetia bacterium]|jgi:excisionase family DNA binding protein